MCLQLNFNGRKQTAKRDIVVYKYVKKIGKTLKTPYQSVTIEIGKTYTSEIEIGLTGTTIHKALHSFKTIEGVKNDFEWYEGMLPSVTFYTVKCIIPKGSTYYNGNFCGLFSYASDTIKYVEIIKH